MNTKTGFETIADVAAELTGHATKAGDQGAIRSKDDAEKALESALNWIGANTRDGDDAAKPPNLSKARAVVQARGWGMYGPAIARRNIPLIVPMVGILKIDEVYKAALRIGELWAMGSDAAAGIEAAFPSTAALSKLDAWIADCNTQISVLQKHGFQGAQATRVDEAAKEVQREMDAEAAAEPKKIRWWLVGLGVGLGGLIAYGVWDTLQDGD